MTSNQRRKKREIRKREILESAKSLFASKGFKKTKMEEIVDKAGTSIGNCYFYFSNKQALLKAVVEDILTRIWEEVDNRSQSIPQWHKRLAINIYSIVITSLKEGDLTHLVLTETPSTRDLSMNFIKKRLYKTLDVAEFKARPDYDLLIHGLQGTSIYMVEKTLAGEIDKTPEELGRFLARWNLQALGVSDGELEEALESLDQFSEINID
jgi:AcrR family transcriptional regulator